MNNITKYNNYFSRQYKYNYSDSDLLNYKKWFAAQWNYINELVSIKRNANILEIGSGIGGLCQFVNDLKPKKYTGLELDNRAVKCAKSNFPHFSFINKPFEDYKSKTLYDYIFAFEVLEHVDDPLETIKKIRSLLVNGGYFIGTSPYPFTKNIKADETHRYVLHPLTWSKFFFENNFNDIRTYPLSFIPGLWKISGKLNIKVPFYIKVPFFISTTLIIAE